jgi:arylsulfatase A-like enzyme
MRARWAAADQRNLVVRYKYEPYLLSPQDMEELKTLYDEEIAYVDARVGELFDWLRQTGLLDNTLVVVTSDHGEHFGEHGLMEHQFTVYEPDVHVPLIVRLPGVFEPGTDDHLVQTHDFFPTALDVAGVDWQPTPAQNCRSLIGPPGNTPRLIVSEYTSPWQAGLEAGLGLASPRAERFAQPVRALREGNTKLLLWDKGYRELYQLDRDPLEVDDLTQANTQEADALTRELRAWLAGLPPPGPAGSRRDLADSPDDLRRLKALGYVQ